MVYVSNVFKLLISHHYIIIMMQHWACRSNIKPFVEWPVILTHSSIQRFYSEITGLQKIKKKVWASYFRAVMGKVLRRGAQPPFLRGNSLYTCYFLSNNGTIAHVCCSLKAVPPSWVFVHVVPLEFHAHYHSQAATYANIVWILQHSTYALCNSMIVKRPECHTW